MGEIKKGGPVTEYALAIKRKTLSGFNTDIS